MFWKWTKVLWIWNTRWTNDRIVVFGWAMLLIKIDFYLCEIWHFYTQNVRAELPVLNYRGQISGKFTWQRLGVLVLGAVVHLPVEHCFDIQVHASCATRMWICVAVGDSVQPSSSFYLGVLRLSGVQHGAGSVWPSGRAGQEQHPYTSIPAASARPWGSW